MRVTDAEDKLRGIIKFTLMYRIGEKEAKETVIRNMEKNNVSNRIIKEAMQLPIKKLFDPSLNQGLYFNVLKDIILENYDLFNVMPGFEDEITLKENLETINISRRVPSHSYTEDSENWNKEKFHKFRKSMTWLEEVLEKM